LPHGTPNLEDLNIENRFQYVMLLH
jgi:hypothetical protein